MQNKSRLELDDYEAVSSDFVEYKEAERLGVFSRLFCPTQVP